MTTITVDELLKKVGAQYREATKGNYIMLCPFCKGGEKEEKTFHIQKETGAWNCKRLNHCGVTGSFSQLLKHYNLGDYVHPSCAMKKQKHYAKPKPQKLDLSPKALQFLKSRGFSEKNIAYFKLRSMDKDGGIVFQYFEDGQHVSNKYRTWDKKFMNDRETKPVLYNRDSIIYRTLNITEGEFDAIALREYGIPAVSVPNGISDLRWIETEYEYLERFETINFFTDLDVAGHSQLYDISVRLGQHRFKIVRLPKKDANDCLMAGISKEEILNCMENGTEIKPKQYRDIGDYADKICERINNPEKFYGMKTGMRKLDDLIWGWREGEVTIWSGDSYSGKSTMLNQMITNAVRMHRITTCIISLEQTPDNYLGKLAKQYYMSVLKNDSNLKKKLMFLAPYIKLVDTTERITPEKIIEDMKYSVKKHGTKHFVIDSLMKFQFYSKDGDQYDLVKYFTDDLCNFAKKYACHIHLVAHSRKRDKDNREPQASDILGTSAIRNLADNIIIMTRTQKEDKEKRINPVAYDGKLLVKKCRESGEEGYINLDFDKSIESFSYHTAVVTTKKEETEW